MKIHYEPYSGFNRRYDFIYLDGTVMSLSFTEPEEPRLMREIGVGYIVEGIIVVDGYSFRGPLMEQLLPEQIRVLLSHAYRIYFRTPIPQFHFINQLRNEVEQIAKQEIEPGMFKNEDTL
jgi:hypothetical protein